MYPNDVVISFCELSYLYVIILDYDNYYNVPAKSFVLGELFILRHKLVWGFFSLYGNEIYSLYFNDL